MIRFLKDWTLPVAIAMGTASYLTFRYVPQLDALGTALAPWFDFLFPLTVFLTLFVTFCKVDFHQMRPHRWHVGILAAQLLLVALNVAIIFWLQSTFNPQPSALSPQPSALSLQPSALSLQPSALSLQPSALSPQPSALHSPLLWEAVLTCIIGPAASASPVVVGKLGGNISTMTTYVLISSLASALMIPMVFPMLEQTVHADFMQAFLVILQKVSIVLLLPLASGWLMQHFARPLCARIAARPNLGFYCWGVSLSITTGITVKNIADSGAAPALLAAIAVATLVLCFVQFGLGRMVGSHLGEEVNAGQALFQKNTALSIWVAYMYLNPVASIGAGCYVLWQNIINSLELYYYKTKRHL